MAGEVGKAVYRRFVEEVVNNGNFDLIDELYDPDYVDHAAPPGAPSPGWRPKVTVGTCSGTMPARSRTAAATPPPTRLPATSEAFIYVAMIRLMVKRLAH